MPRPSLHVTRQRRRQILLAAAVTAWAPAARAERPAGVLRFGLTPVFLDERVRVLQQWRLYLEAALGSAVEFVQRSTYAQVMDVLRAGQVDLAWICGFPYVLRARELQLLAVPHWRGRPYYQSYLIADAQSARTGNGSLAALRGRSFAYSDPLSNSGFLYPQHLLRSQGHDPARFFSRSFFTHSHRHVVEAVAEGLADAGAVDGYVWETLAALNPALTRRTRVIHTSPDFGFPPIVAPVSLSTGTRQALSRALFDMQHQAAGRAVLADLRLDRFGPADVALFHGIAQMARLHGTQR